MRKKPRQAVEPSRQTLLAALEREVRLVSAQSTLFSQLVAAQLGIASADLECLDIILLEGPVTAGQLAQATGLSTGAITGVLDRLERAGLARRERDPADRRRVLARAAEDAQARVMPHFQSLHEAMTGLWSSYTDGELALIRDFAARSSQVFRAEAAKLRPRR